MIIGDFGKVLVFLFGTYLFSYHDMIAAVDKIEELINWKWQTGKIIRLKKKVFALIDSLL